MQPETLGSQTLGLVMVGNSRSHWGLFSPSTRPRSQDQSVMAREGTPSNLPGCSGFWPTLWAWDGPHLCEPLTQFPDLPSDLALPSGLVRPNPASPNPLAPSRPLPLWFASVVPDQTRWFQTYAQAQEITLADVPLGQLYPGFGIDRALGLWGAGNTYGWPVLLIDGGTALTITGGDRTPSLVGGAILPGFGLQRRSLHQATAALPEIDPSATLPPRWARSTEAAIASGILYTLQAGLLQFCHEWLHHYPTSPIVITGGDGLLLLNLLQTREPTLASRLIQDPHIVLKGLGAIAQTYT